MKHLLQEREIYYEAHHKGLNEGLIEGRNEGLIRGRAEAHSEMLNAIVDLMHSNIISPEQFEAIKAAAFNTQQIK